MGIRQGARGRIRPAHHPLVANTTTTECDTMSTNTQRVEQCYICSEVSSNLIAIPKGPLGGETVAVCKHHPGVITEAVAHREYEAERAWEHEVVVAEVDV